MNRMTWIAAALLVGLGAVFAVGWFASGDEAPTSAGGNVTPVKVDAALAEQGEAVASSQGCTACHTIDGSTSAGPTWAGSYGTEVELDSGETTKVNDAYLKESILDPGAQITAGYSPSMPAFEGKISDQDLTALVEYIKSLQG